jgi:Nucleotidyl transferase AbiEii toxin, Type IV TA system
MDRIARLPAAERNALFSESAARMGTTPAVIEKDFWVTWVLARLFGQPELARLLMFKGGTSLSKAYGLIERFSEDIDLILDWRVLGKADPLAERSKSRQVKLNEVLNENAQVYIHGKLLPRITATLDGICTCEVEGGDPHVVMIRYPGAYPANTCGPTCGWRSGRWHPGCRMNRSKSAVMRPRCSRKFSSRRAVR